MAFLGKPVIHLSHSLHDGWMYEQRKTSTRILSIWLVLRGCLYTFPTPSPPAHLNRSRIHLGTFWLTRSSSIYNIICVASVHEFLFCHIQHFWKIHLPLLDNQELCINWIAEKTYWSKAHPTMYVFPSTDPNVLKWMYSMY